MTCQSSEQVIPNHVEAVLRVLNSIVPANHANSASNGSSRRWANYLLWAGGLSFLLLAVLAFAHSLGTLPGWLVYVALFLGCAAQLLPALALSLDALAGLAWIFKFQEKAGHMRVAEWRHDTGAAQKLMIYPDAVLRAADSWLSQYMDRQERRLKLFFAGSDKLAAFSVIGGALSALRTFPEAQEVISKVAPFLASGNGLAWLNWTLVLMFAFLFGLTFGAVLVRQVIQREAYQRDLLALAQRTRTM